MNTADVRFVQQQVLAAQRSGYPGRSEQVHFPALTLGGMSVEYLIWALYERQSQPQAGATQSAAFAVR